MRDNETPFDAAIGLVYSELGRFNVQFERGVHYMKDAIKAVLVECGLVGLNYSDILLGGMTADPIKRIAERVLNEYFQDEHDKKKLAVIITLLTDLIEIRNLLVHCYWALGTSKTDQDDAVEVPFIFGIKTRISKKGVSLYNLELELEELEMLNTDVEYFVDLAHRLASIIEDGCSDLNTLDVSILSHVSFKAYLEKIKSAF